jgi:hypothetical protein
MVNVAPAMPDHNSTGKNAFIVGLIGLVLAFVPFIGFASWLLGPLSILMGLIALRKPSPGRAIAGIKKSIFINQRMPHMTFCKG